MQNRGHESIVCYGRGIKYDEAGIFKTCPEWMAKINSLWSRISGVMYGSLINPNTEVKQVIKREKPDVVHLHCINAFCFDIYDLVNYLKVHHIPTLFTLHAEFIHTANCGYAFDCEKWKTGCGKCPRPKQATNTWLLDNTALSWKKMKESFDGFEDVMFASVSPWLMNRAKQSPILADKQHTYVLNGLDTKIFSFKENNIIHFLWVGRFIDWKHPEKAVYLAEYLQKSGYVFKMNMLGDGPMLDEIATLISKKGLSERINMLGSLKPSGVRSVMDASDVFIYTSDFNEGWGAVLNEAMASGCIAVASHAIGSAPFLIQDGVNGFLYQNDDIHTLTSVVEKILNMEYRQRIEIATRAKDTISELWNANIAAQRLKKLAETLLSGDTHFLYENGPCSCAPILTNNWFESM